MILLMTTMEAIRQRMIKAEMQAVMKFMRRNTLNLIVEDMEVVAVATGVAAATEVKMDIQKVQDFEASLKAQQIKQTQPLPTRN